MDGEMTDKEKVKHVLYRVLLGSSVILVPMITLFAIGKTFVYIFGHPFGLLLMFLLIPAYLLGEIVSEVICERENTSKFMKWLESKFGRE